MRQHTYPVHTTFTHGSEYFQFFSLGKRNFERLFLNLLVETRQLIWLLALRATPFLYFVVLAWLNIICEQLARAMLPELCSFVCLRF